MTATFLTAIAFAVGMRVGGSGVDLPALYLLAALVNVAAVLWACGVAMRLRTIQAFPVMQFPVFLALFFAPVYVPLHLLQGWIHGVAYVNPLTRVLEAGRSFIAGSPSRPASRSASRPRSRCCSRSGRCAGFAAPKPRAESSSVCERHARRRRDACAARTNRSPPRTTR